MHQQQKKRILQPRNQNALLHVKMLASMSLKVCRKNAKVLTPNLQNNECTVTVELTTLVAVATKIKLKTF
jgi:hypothetical protein